MSLTYDFDANSYIDWTVYAKEMNFNLFSNRRFLKDLIGLSEIATHDRGIWKDLGLMYSFGMSCIGVLSNDFFFFFFTKQSNPEGIDNLN